MTILEKRVRRASERFYMKQAKHIKKLMLAVPESEQMNVFNHFCMYNAESYREKHYVN